MGIIAVQNFAIIQDPKFSIGAPDGERFWERTFTLETQGLGFTGDSILSFMLDTLTSNRTDFTVSLNDSRVFRGNYGSNVFHAVHEVVSGAIDGENVIKFELSEGSESEVRFGDVVLYFQRFVDTG